MSGSGRKKRDPILVSSDTEEMTEQTSEAEAAAVVTVPASPQVVEIRRVSTDQKFDVSGELGTGTNTSLPGSAPGAEGGSTSTALDDSPPRLRTGESTSPTRRLIVLIGSLLRPKNWNSRALPLIP